MEHSVALVSWLGPIGVQRLSKKWGWVLAQGIALVVLGLVAATYSWAATVVSVITLGYVIVFGGLVQIVGSFWVREWSGFFVELLMGIFGAVVGFMMIAHPLAAGSGLTLLLAVYLMVEGVFRTVAAFSHRIPGSGAGIFSGLVTFLLGLMVYAEWPASSLWLLGTFLAVRLLFSGFATLSLAMLLRRLKA